METEVKKYLYDIQEACRLILEFTAGHDFITYQSNSMLKSAVERQFITAGEALNQLLKKYPDIESEITKARKLVDFRNILTHGYASIEDAVVWDIVETNLPQLYEEVSSLLKSKKEEEP